MTLTLMVYRIIFLQRMGDEFEGLLGPGSLCLGNESDEDEF